MFISVVGKHSGTLYAELDAAGIQYERRLPTSGVIRKSGETIEIITGTAAAFAAVASMFRSWMRATASRKVFITTNDSMVFHAEGLSVEEIARLLSIAKNTIAFDKSKTGESTPRLPCDSE